VWLAESLLLLLKQFIEASALCRRKPFAKFIFCPLHFLPQLWGDRFHELFGAFLAFLQNLIDALALPCRQIQFPFHPAKKLDSHETLVTGWSRVPGDCRVLRRRRSVMPAIQSANKQTTCDHAGGENNKNGKDDFPGLHRAESAGCSW